MSECSTTEYALTYSSGMDAEREIQLFGPSEDDVLEPDDDDFILHPHVLDRLEVMGFYGPAQCGYHKLDRHLITALVERWRPETHTFHFPIGEVTITL
ncbi:hypothetical protein ACS0TY_006791 [Phlomoides rotata]